MFSPEEYWTNFSEAFIRTLREDTQENLFKAWQSPSARTDYYIRSILPRIKNKLGLEYKEELFKVDAVFYDKSNNIDIPAIFIESENNAFSAHEEIKKLCCLSCPLAILITVAKWNFNQFPSTSEKDKLLFEWEQIINAYSSAFPVNGILSIMVGEFGKDKILRFYTRKYLRNKSNSITENEIEIKKIA